MRPASRRLAAPGAALCALEDALGKSAATKRTARWTSREILQFRQILPRALLVHAQRSVSAPARSAPGRLGVATAADAESRGPTKPFAFRSGGRSGASHPSPRIDLLRREPDSAEPGAPMNLMDGAAHNLGRRDGSGLVRVATSPSADQQAVGSARRTAIYPVGGDVVAPVRGRRRPLEEDAAGPRRGAGDQAPGALGAVRRVADFSLDFGPSPVLLTALTL